MRPRRTKTEAFLREGVEGCFPHQTVARSLAVERRQAAWLSGPSGVILDISLNVSIPVVRI